MNNREIKNDLEQAHRRISIAFEEIGELKKRIPSERDRMYGLSPSAQAHFDSMEAQMCHDKRMFEQELNGQKDEIKEVKSHHRGLSVKINNNRIGLNDIINRFEQHKKNGVQHPKKEEKEFCCDWFEHHVICGNIVKGNCLNERKVQSNAFYVELKKRNIILEYCPDCGEKCI